MKIELRRVSSDDDRTFGVLIHNGSPFAVTLERGWRDNRRGESCIPPGDYIARRCNASSEYGFKDSPHFGDTFVVENVPGRKHILFHKGNLDDDTHGCIIVAAEFGVLSGEPAVLNSAKGFGKFLQLMNAENIFRLVVR